MTDQNTSGPEPTAGREPASPEQQGQGSEPAPRQPAEPPTVEHESAEPWAEPVAVEPVAVEPALVPPRPSEHPTIELELVEPTPVGPDPEVAAPADPVAAPAGTPAAAEVRVKKIPGLTAATVRFAAVTAAIGYLAALALGLLLAIGTIVFVDVEVSGGAVVAAPFQLAGLVLGGTLTMTPVGAGAGPWAGSVSIGLLPWLAMAVPAAAIVVVARRAAARADSPAPRWTAAVLCGIVLAVLAAVLTAVTPTTLEVAGGRIRVGALSPSLFVVAFVLGLLAYALGQAWPGRRVDLTRLGLGTPRRLAVPGLVVATHLAPVLVAVTVAVVIRAVAEAPSVLVFFPLWLGAVVAHGVGIVLLGSSAVGGGADWFLDGVAGSSTVGLFSGLDGWLVAVAVVLAVLSAVLAGTLLAVRRPVQPTAWRGVWVVPLVYAVVGLVLVCLSWISVTVWPGWTADVQGSFHLEPAFLVVAALWGVFVELFARFVSPYVLGLFPPLLPLLSAKPSAKPSAR